MSHSERIEQLSPLQKAVLALKEMRARLDAVEQARSEPVAVVGIGCRFPGASGPEAFRRLLREAGMRQSMSARANPYHNAWTESFMGTLKTEMLENGSFIGHTDARTHFLEHIPTAAASLREVLAQIPGWERLGALLAKLSPLG